MLTSCWMRKGSAAFEAAVVLRAQWCCRSISVAAWNHCAKQTEGQLSDTPTHRGGQKRCSPAMHCRPEPADMRCKRGGVVSSNQNVHHALKNMALPAAAGCGRAHLIPECRHILRFGHTPQSRGEHGKDKLVAAYFAPRRCRLQLLLPILRSGDARSIHGCGDGACARADGRREGGSEGTSGI